jgi:flagellar motility protein MotE (MotC chaperone)
VTKEQPRPQDEKPAEETKPAAPKKKSALVKYIIFGVIGVVAVGAVAVGTVFLLGGATHKVEEAANGADSTSVTHDSSAAHAEMTPEDSLQRIADSLAGSMEDTSLLADVKKNLAFLDGASADSTMKADSVKAAQDSVIAMGWIGKEKERITQKENDLNIREVKLNKLDQEIARKLLKIEQVTTSKITDLAKLYDGIEPKAVAAMMANLDDETIVAVLPRMKQKIAAQVLGMMPPARAAQISKQMIEIAEN